MLRVISLRRKRQPVGTVLAAKASLPISESNFILWLSCTSASVSTPEFHSTLLSVTVPVGGLNLALDQGR